MKTTQFVTTWRGIDVVVIEATTLAGTPLHEVESSYPDEHVRVRVSFPVEGPASPNDPPWGPMAEQVFPLSDLAGPVEYRFYVGDDQRRMVVRDEDAS